MKLDTTPKIALIGGDVRQLVIAEALALSGANVYFYGDFETLPNGVFACNGVEEAAQNSECVILPMPLTRDSVYLNFSENSKVKIKITDAFGLFKDKVVLAGHISPMIKDYAMCEKIRLIDYYDSEELRIKNAYLTAEGAVFVAMQKLDVALKDARFAITGFGRIASMLAHILKALRADVTVAARKEKDLAIAQALGCKTLKIGLCENKTSTLSELANSYDVIFNTVPSWIFDEAFFKDFSKNTVIIELASSPGGFDMSIAEKYGANVAFAQGLPGKYAKVSAGRCAFESIKKILEREMIL